MPKLNDVVPLSLKLFDDDDSLFVRAIVTDESGTTISGSPFSLVNVGEGLYELDTLLMPNKLFLTAVYQVFNDAGFTSKSNKYTDAVDNFPLVFIDPEVIECLDELKALLNLILAKGVTVEIQGIVEQAQEIVGNLLNDNEEITGFVETSNDDIIGEIEDDESEIQGVLDDNDEIEGDIDE